ncbi:MAG: sensor histidine kinase [Propionibacteriaceae bacterium]
MKHRLSLTLIAFVAILISMIGLAPFVLSLTSLSLLVVWIGIPMLLVSTALLRAFVTPWRIWSGWVLGHEIVRPYRAIPTGGWFARLRWIVTDSATWRDLVWVLVNITAGFSLAILTVALLAGSLFYLAYPVLLEVTPYGLFNNPLGLFVLTKSWQGVFMWPVAGVLFGLWWLWAPGLMHGWAALHNSLLGPSKTAVLAGRVAALAASRADTVDSAAREVRRIERDLHDGVQVRLVSLGMSLGLAEEMIDTDPERAKVLISEANAATSGTLQDLRTLVRGIHPPVLADRGLVGAVRAIALDAPMTTSVVVKGFGSTDEAREDVRLEAPVEACAYFAVAETLANVIKHAKSSRVDILVALRTRADHHKSDLHLTITDDGTGGAVVAPGGGLAGVTRRLAAFDGILQVESPRGGPTTITMEIPCEPLSPKTTRSSAKA